MYQQPMAPEHEYIFSKYSWSLIKNIILKMH